MVQGTGYRVHGTGYKVHRTHTCVGFTILITAASTDLVQAAGELYHVMPLVGLHVLPLLPRGRGLHDTALGGMSATCSSSLTPVRRCSLVDYPPHTLLHISGQGEGPLCVE